NIRQDPFERTPSSRGQSLNDQGGGYLNDFYAREFWRFVMVQQEVAKLAQTAIDYPPMQAPASFNLEAVKRQVDELIKSHEGQWNRQVRGGRVTTAPAAIFVGLIMVTLRVLIFSAMAVAASVSAAFAGPCADQIDAMQARFDAKLDAKAAAGPTAKESV